MTRLFLIWLFHRTWAPILRICLVKILDVEWFVSNPFFREFEKLQFPAMAAAYASAPLLKDSELQFGKGFVHRTTFGENFIAACHTR
jgi:hypothetical protein